MNKENRLKLIKFRMLLKKLNSDVLVNLQDVLTSEWQLELIKLELNRRG